MPTLKTTKAFQYMEQGTFKRDNMTSFKVKPFIPAPLTKTTQTPTASAGQYLFRTAPLAGALYPIKTYIAAERVKGVEQGADLYTVSLLKNRNPVKAVSHELVTQGWGRAHPPLCIQVECTLNDDVMHSAAPEKQRTM